MLKFIKEHKVAAIVVAVAVIVFVAWSVWQFNNRQTQIAHEQALKIEAEAQAAKTAEDTPAQDSTTGADTTVKAESESADEIEAEKVSDGLNEEQKLIIDGYGEEEKNLLAILTANVWLELTSNANLRFDENSYTEISGSEQKKVSFAIMHVAPNNIVGEGAEYESMIAMIKADDSNIYFLKLQRSKKSGEKAGVWHVFCEAFALGEDYYRGKASKTIKIDKLEESAASQLGGRDKIEAALTDYTSLSYPAAKTASWDGVVETDWENRIVTTHFSLDTQPKVSLTITFNMDSKEIAIR